MGVGGPGTHSDVTFSTEGIGVWGKNDLMRTFLSTGELGTERETFPVIIQSAITKNRKFNFDESL